MTSTPALRASEFTRRSVGAAFACAIGTMVASGTAIIGTFSVFMLPILAEFGWGRGRISGVVMTMSCTTALVSPLIGRWFDRWGVRRIVLPGLVLYGASVMLLSRARPDVVWFYLSYFVVGVPAALISIVPYVKTVAGWFNRQRGLVLALVGVGAMAGGALMPLYARWLIATFGWRDAYVGIGLLILGLGFPVLWFLLREPPRVSTPVADAAPAADTTSNASATPAANPAPAAPPHALGPSAYEVRRDPTYWLLIAVTFFGTFAVGGVMGHLVPLVVDHGLGPATAASVLSLCLLGSIGGRLLMGWLLDRFESPRVAVPFFAGAVAGLGLLALGTTVPTFVAAGVLIGMCAGAEGEFAPYLHTRYFGLRAFAETYALQFLFLAVANGVGILLAGVAFDAFGSYLPWLAVAGGLFAATGVIFFWLGPYRYDPRIAARAEPGAAPVPPVAAVAQAQPRPATSGG